MLKWAAVMLIPTGVFAQNAQLSGFVSDPSQARVPKANLTITNDNTGSKRSTDSNSDGLYTFPGLEPGKYSVLVEASGFQPERQTGIQLEVAQNARLDFTLRVGDTKQEVSVQADALSINTTDATVSMTVNRDLVENLPLNGRSFQQLITLAPGVNLTGSQNAGDLGEFSVNGQRPTANYFTVDGVGANLGSNYYGMVGLGETLSAAGGTNSMVSVDALQEFRILTSSFAPEYGRTPGGQVILLTRSGSNAFHGTAFEYFRNDVLDANDWFANRVGAARAPLRFNDFGGTLGGPIVKDKTFFFFSYEGQQLRQPGFSVTSVPDIASRQAAPPAVQALLNSFPVPNGPELGSGFAEFSAGYSNPIKVNTTSFRVDQIFSPTLSAFARYSYAPSSSLQRGGELGLSSVFNFLYRPQSVTGGLTYAITPTVVNETRVNWSKNAQTQSNQLDNFGGAVPIPLSSLLVLPATVSDALAIHWYRST